MPPDAFSMGIGGTGLAVTVADAGPPNRLTNIHGTIWVANRGAHTIRAYDAATGDVVNTVAMAPNSQPGDLAYANGKLYVAEEFATPNPAIAIVSPATGVILNGTSTRPPPTDGRMPPNSRRTEGPSMSQATRPARSSRWIRAPAP